MNENKAHLLAKTKQNKTNKNDNTAHSGGHSQVMTAYSRDISADPLLGNVGPVDGQLWCEDCSSIFQDASDLKFFY